MANRYTKQKIDIGKAISLYESGMTQTEVADALNTTQRVIWARFKQINYRCRVPFKRNQFGERNTSWAGNKVTYKGAHIRVGDRRGNPKSCEVCGTNDSNKWYEWANLTGNYPDPNDYKRMCRSCHRKFDKERRIREVMPNAIRETAN